MIRQADITTRNIEETQQKYRLGTVSESERLLEECVFVWWWWGGGDGCGSGGWGGGGGLNSFY